MIIPETLQGLLLNTYPRIYISPFVGAIRTFSAVDKRHSEKKLTRDKNISLQLCLPFMQKCRFLKEWTALINCYIVSPKGQWSNTVLDSWFLAVDSGSGNLDSGFQSVAVFRILELNFVIPIRIILHGAICFCFAVADYCKNNQCPQNATCVNGRESFTCRCNSPGWTGDQCDQGIPQKINYACFITITAMLVQYQKATHSFELSSWVWNKV